MAISTALFAHRRNADGSCGSICRACYSVVACSVREEELARYEKTHACDSSFLADRGTLHHTEALRRVGMPIAGQDLWP